MFPWVALLLLLCITSSLARKPQYGLISSPNYPKTYPNDNHSIWNIAVPEGYHISLRFLVFDIEPSEGCTYDYVKVWADNKELGRFCGPTRYKSHPGQRQFLSEGNKMKIEFQSDFSNEENGSTVLYPGFQAYYQALDYDECALPNDISVEWNPPCQHFCHNYIGGFFCSCRPGYQLQRDKRTCKVDCSSQLFTEDSGFISSPEYPQPYPADLSCNYSIRVEEGLQITLSFLDPFDIDDHPQVACPYDTLKVFEGGTLLGSYCGRKSPGILQTRSHEVDLVFQTDESGDSQGWKLSYTTEPVKCPSPAPKDQFSVIHPTQATYHWRDYIVVECKKGYQLTENKKPINTFTSVCKSNGKWNRPLPDCEIVSCGHPEELRNGQYTYLKGTVTYGSSVNYTCNEPYYRIVTQRESTTFTCSEDAAWKDENGGRPIPLCAPVCGNPSNSVTKHGRIIQGEKAKLGNFPWQVLINKHARGGGFLIGEHWVMTAAHVIRPKPEDTVEDDSKNVDVFIGDINTYKMTERGSLSVQEVHVHPEYIAGIHDHDIALIRLTDPVTMDHITSPICLPQKGDESLYDADTIGYVSGFGETEKKTIANDLRYVKLPVVERDRCQKQLVDKQKLASADEKTKNEKFTENMFCAGYPEAKKQQKDSCQGDSGGAFTSPNDQKWVATGIVSWGIDCGKGYGYYTKVRNYIDWVNSFVNN
ncbi:complement C1r subcomponent [Hyperolius riggenbachi]|uniref:complement C1r subcomponent n=1 Tax=Hyperolius riggenbachi TaxID=752182 RepID=UPI0035A3604F